MRSTSSLRQHWRQLDSRHLQMITWLIVFLVLALTFSIMATLSTSEDPNAHHATPTSTTTTRRTATPVTDQTVTVAAVVDGRTIIGSDGAQVFVEGLGQPGQCWAEAALDFAKTHLLGKQVWIDAEIVRLLPDGEDFAVLMVSRGLGRMKAGARTAISDAQDMAKSAGLGLWGEPCGGSDAPPPPPPTTTTSPAGTTTTPPPPPPQVVAAVARCTATYRMSQRWNDGFNGEVTIGAGSTAISSWTATVAMTAPQKVTVTWNGTPSWDAGGNVMTMKPNGNGSLPAGGSTTFGFTVTANGQWNAPAVSCGTP